MYELSGLARGCGWQHLIVYVNMTSFYLIGMPAAILLGFKFELHAKVMVVMDQAHHNYKNPKLTLAEVLKFVDAGTVDRINMWYLLSSSGSVDHNFKRQME
ncbi:hypothetical protein SAY87_003870 [Trapa incisa]|uniref:Uncharacterized protein n=1 Tax=Trapa incisa TaxID=236973 RepID=A0AAN7KJU6_9MYRT|nr:hypothetical protein SAY87_003870 [Trapa incisa]